MFTISISNFFLSDKSNKYLPAIVQNTILNFRMFVAIRSELQHHAPH